MRHVSWVSALALMACQGEGSEIGPQVPKLPDESFRVLVQDDTGRGVVNALVSIAGFEADATTTLQTGRADLFVTPSGRRVVRIDTAGAVATEVDHLGSLRFAADMQPADHLPFVVRVPDLAGSASPEVSVGVLAQELVLDDTAWSGAELRVSAGATIGTDDGAARVVVRTGALRADHIPPLRLPDGSAALVGRAIDIDPPGVSFQPGGSLLMPNDLGLRTGGTATVFRLEPSDGEWHAVGTVTVESGGRLRAPSGSIGGGGLYAVAMTAPSTATVIGTAIEPRFGVELPARLGGVRVRAGQVFGIADGSGRFVLDGVPVSDAAGAQRDITLQFAGGRLQVPSSEERALTAAPGAVVDLGEIQLDVLFSAAVRALVIGDGRFVANTDLGIGSRTSADGGLGLTDDSGYLGFEAVDAGHIGFFAAWPDSREMFNIQTINASIFTDATRSFDIQLFANSEPWTDRDAEYCALFVLDARSLAAIEGARVYRLRSGVDELAATTLPDRIDLVDLRGDEAVAKLSTAAGGRTIHSAFTVRPQLEGRAEFPLLRVPRPQPGAFVPFGWVSGDAPSSGTVRQARATGVVTAETWTEAVIDGRSLDAATPVRREPSRDGGTAFELGVPSRGGALIAWSGTATAIGTTVGEFAFADGLRPSPGATVVLATGAPVPFATEFVIPGAAATVDPLVAPGEFRVDLGIELPNGRVLDVLRGVLGHASTRGEDVVIALPELTGPLAGARHLVRWRGQSTRADVVRSQAVFARLDGAEILARSALPLPTILSPNPGTHVPVSGFEIRYQLPAGTEYGMVRLHADDGVELRDWTVIVPPTETVASFRHLPDDPQVLAPGRYTVEVTAVRADDGFGRDFEYSFGLFAARWSGIGSYERGVDAMSSVRFEVEVDG